MNKPPDGWTVTAFPNGKPPVASVARSTEEVRLLLRMTPREGYYTIDPMYLATANTDITQETEAEFDQIVINTILQGDSQ